MCFVPMNDMIQLSESQLSYLQAVYYLSKLRKKVKGSDIAEYLSVSNAAVTGALQHLVKIGMIFHKPYRVVLLSPKGKRAVWSFLHRQRAWYEFFVDVLGVSSEEAQKEASNISCALSDSVEQKLITFLEKKQVARDELHNAYFTTLHCCSPHSFCRYCTQQVKKIG